ncbi:hypothetical protein M569_13253, partial [Genlisea aurea]
VIGAFIIVEMLYTTSLLAIVGAGEQASLSPRKLVLFNTVDETALQELNFLTSIVAVRINRERLVVVLQEQTYLYDIKSLKIKQVIDTVPNLKGLCAFSTSMENPYLALPSSATKGSVLVYNATDLQSHCEIDAHRSPLAAMTFSSNGMYLATASEQGTIVRVHPISEATKTYSFRRGAYASKIFSLSFSPSTDLPDVLIATSSSGSAHIFSIDCDHNDNRTSSNFLGSIIPSSVYDSNHLVFHRASSPGAKSIAVIRKVEKTSTDGSALTAVVSIISLSGNFREYSLRMNERGEAKWNLEKDHNLSKA